MKSVDGGLAPKRRWATGRKRHPRYWLRLRCLWCGQLVALQRNRWEQRYRASGRWSPFCGRRCYGLWKSVEARRNRGRKV